MDWVGMAFLGCMWAGLPGLNVFHKVSKGQPGHIVLACYLVEAVIELV